MAQSIPKYYPKCLNKPVSAGQNELTPLLASPDSPLSTTQPSELSGYFYIALSCIAFPGTSFFTHIALNRYNFPVGSSIIIRSIFHTVFCMLYFTCFLPFPQTFTTVSTRQWKLLVFRGFAGSLGLLFFILSLQRLPVGDTVTVFFCSPVIVMLLSNVLLSEPITAVDIIAAVTSLTGIVLIARPDFSASTDLSPSDRICGVIYGLASAVCTAAAYVTIRSMGTTIHFTLCIFMLGFASLFMPIFVGGVLGPVGLMAQKEGSLLMAIASVFSLAGQCCLTKGLQISRAGPASLIRNVDVPISYILGMLFLQESPTYLRLLGSTLVLFSALMIGIRQLIRPGLRSDQNVGV